MTDRLSKIILILLSMIGAYLIFLKVDWIHRGGPVMILIIFSSIFAFAIILAKMRQFSQDSLDVENFLKNIFERMERQRIKEAIDLCDQTHTPLARILKAGIIKYDRPKDEIKEAMDDSFLYEIPLLEGNLSLLSTIVQIAPLLGFLGTVVGMIKIFGIIEAKAASVVPVVAGDLAPGIWEALTCTAAGFLLAIPILIAHNYLVNRVKSLVDEMERGATELLAFFMERRMSP